MDNNYKQWNNWGSNKNEDNNAIPDRGRKPVISPIPRSGSCADNSLEKIKKTEFVVGKPERNATLNLEEEKKVELKANDFKFGNLNPPQPSASNSAPNFGQSYIFGTPFWHLRQELPIGITEWAYSLKDTLKPMGRGSGSGFQSMSTVDFDLIPPQFVESLQSYFKDFPTFRYDNWWVNIQNKGDYNLAHLHELSDLTAIWYLTDNHGTLYLHNPLGFGRYVLHDVLKPPGFDPSGIEITANAGDMIVFPSDIMHEVREHKFDTPRISLSFNLKLYPSESTRVNIVQED